MVNTDAKTRDKSLIIIFLFYCFAMSQSDMEFVKKNYTAGFLG